MSMIRFSAVAALLLLAASTGVSANTVTSPMYALDGLKGRIDWKYNFQWRYVTNSESAGGDMIAIHMYWAAGRYAAIGFSPVNMQGYITACNVPAANPADAVCTDVIGFNGGGVQRNPTQYSKLLWAKSVDGGNFVEAEIEVPVSAVNISLDAKGNTRLIFAASTWNSTSNMPEPHSAKGKCILHVNPKKGTVADSDYPIATQASHVFQPFSNYGVWWYVVFNGTNGSGSYLSANFQLSGNNWAGLGFASQGMNGRIVICRYGETSGASCGDYNGMDYGIKLAATQRTKVEYHFSSKDMHSIGVAIPLDYSDYTINNALTNMVNRTIFATSTWNSTSNFPNPHDAKGHQIRNIDFFRNEVYSVAPFTTVYESLPNAYYTTWGLIGAGPSFGNLKLRVALVHLNGYYAGFGFANVSMGGPLVACYTPADSAIGVQCGDFIGHKEGGVSTNPEQSSLVIASVVDAKSGLTNTIVDIDLAKFNVSTESIMNMDYQRIIQAYGAWDSKAMKPTYHGPNATYWEVNLLTGAVNGTGPATLPPTGATGDLADAASMTGAFASLKKFMLPDVKNMIHISNKKW